MTREISVSLLQDWKLVYDAIKNDLKPKTIFLMSGDLGSGKTTFINFVCEANQIPLSASPTYSIIHEYNNENLKIIHVDLYRLETEDEIISSGFWDILSNEKSIIFVEWPSRISDQDWPLDWSIVEINIDLIGQDRRVRIVNR